MSEMRQYMMDFMTNHELSLSRLAEILGYKSKTSLVRLMEESSREKSVLQFAEALSKAFELTADERTGLERAVQITVHGRAQYLAECEMWRFVQGDTQPNQAPPTITNIETGEVVDLPERYAGMARLEITLLNSHSTAIFPVLKQLLDSGCTTVEHFIYADGNDAKTICAVNSLLTIFYEKGYSGHVCMANRYDEATAPQGVMRADLMAVSGELPDGSRTEDVIVFGACNTASLLAHQGSRGPFDQLLGLRRELYTPIKRSYFHCSALENYIQYSQDYADLEKNRAIWKIKPDAGVDWIPVQILAAAFMEGPAGENGVDDETYQALYDVYNRRFQNTVTKHKPAYTIMKRSAMHKFTLTGRTSDHFWGMRPYTPRERAVILTGLLEQQLNNPYFHIYFLKDDAALRNVEIACYEDLGMLILESDTDYNLAAGHSEIMLTHPELMCLFRDFFMNELVKRHALPEAETIRFLQELVEEAGNQR